MRDTVQFEVKIDFFYMIFLVTANGLWETVLYEKGNCSIPGNFLLTFFI